MMIEQNLNVADLPNEVWKSINGYEGLYVVSNYGRIKSLERVVIDSQGKSRVLKERIKKYAVSLQGYPVVSLCKHSNTNVQRVHRIVATAFIPNPDNKPHIDHINRDTLDFRLENLRWVTPKENINNPNSVEYCRTHVDKRLAATKANKTKRAKGTKTAPYNVYRFDLDGNLLEEYESCSEAERKFGVHSSGIRSVLNKPSYTIGGYLWATTRQINYKYSPIIQPYFKPIKQIGRDGEIVGEWPSITRAAKALGVSRKVIEKGLMRGGNKNASH